MFEWHYKGGEFDGPAREFYKAGAIKSEEKYVQGKLSGEARKYYEDGTLMFLDVYEDGNLVKSQK
jgi:antitoxin component YwqK of YwqJK toxin-antitoxin module